MKQYLYLNLAIMGIRKNKRIYVPYILTCIGMVMMYYILHCLGCSPLLKQMSGGNNMQMILSMGKNVIMVFAAVFLFYTNSFLVRSRNKEFGLYHILGMNKSSVAHIVAWESLLVSILSLAAGMATGIAFSKFAELGLLNAMHADINYDFILPKESILNTILVFAVIFFLLFLKSMIQVYSLAPLELMRSEHMGEKPPKANWFLAVAGAVILAAAYIWALSIKSPLTAMVAFSIAVIMVIVGTYLLFISGSVALCRLLQKNKHYYYQKNHFISVGSMVFRMKRNGAGLASICILSTMVLVVAASTVSLFVGEEDMIYTRYPYESEIDVYIPSLQNMTDENMAQLTSAYQTVFDQHKANVKQSIDYKYADIVAYDMGNKLEPEVDNVSFNIDYDKLLEIFFIDVHDYNKIMGTDLSLHAGEAMLYTSGFEYKKETFSMNGIELNIAGTLNKNIPVASDLVLSSTMTLIIPDFQTLLPLSELVSYTGDKMLDLRYYYGCNLDVSDEEVIAINEEQKQCIETMPFLMKENGSFACSASSRAEQKDSFYTLFGGLFFIGIMISLAFLAATVLIIYYKQISEGYEDQARFEIMQKVGMTKRDIKKSINSQVLTVFFLPLIFAGMHLAFAFPLLWKMLKLFHFNNLKLIILVTIGAFLIFSVFYAIVYKLTAGSYFNIVSGAKEHE